MRFLILHESPGRLRLRTDVKRMSLEQADLLEAWLRAQPDVQQVSVHERTFCVTVVYKRDRAALLRTLAVFSYEKAAQELHPLPHSSRAMNRAYKEKLVCVICNDTPDDAALTACKALGAALAN